MIRPRTAWVTTLALLAVGPASLGVAGENGPSPYGEFAFADSSGTRVLAGDPLAHPEAVHTLIVPPGRILHVVYEGTQAETGKGSGRDASWNFKNLGGQLFRIQDGRIGVDQDCFLATDSLLSLGAPIPITGGKGGCDLTRRERYLLEAKKGRRVAQCWRLASILGAGIELIEFEAQGRSHLAGIALTGAKQVRMFDYPAEVREEDPTSVWRVDDEGVLSQEEFDVMFVLQGRSGRFVGIFWAGTEGNAFELLRFPTGADPVSVANGSRYLSPS